MFSLGGALERLARYLREAIAVEFIKKKKNVNAIHYMANIRWTSLSASIYSSQLKVQETANF